MPDREERPGAVWPDGSIFCRAGIRYLTGRITIEERDVADAVAAGWRVTVAPETPAGLVVVERTHLA